MISKTKLYKVHETLTFSTIKFRDIDLQKIAGKSSASEMLFKVVFNGAIELNSNDGTS